MPLLRRIASINETLARMQGTGPPWPSDECDDGTLMRCAHDELYAAQLQLVRTLQPPCLRGMMRGGGNPREDGAPLLPSSCVPPPYDLLSNLFLIGLLRLFGTASKFHRDGPPQERVARLTVPGGEDGALRNRYWDVYYNILPVGALVQIYPPGRMWVQTRIANPIAPAPFVPK